MKQVIAILTLGFFLLASGRSFPQSNMMSVDSLASRESQSLSRIFNLNETKKAEILVASKDLHSQLKGLRELKTDSSQRRAKVSQIQKKYNKALKKILSTQQYKQYKDLTASRKAKLKARLSQRGIKMKEAEVVD